VTDDELKAAFPDSLPSPSSKDHPTRLVPLAGWIAAATKARDELG
jgi:hypothetical protein